MLWNIILPSLNLFGHTIKPICTFSGMPEENIIYFSTSVEILFLCTYYIHYIKYKYSITYVGVYNLCYEFYDISYDCIIVINRPIFMYSCIYYYYVKSYSCIVAFHSCACAQRLSCVSLCMVARQPMRVQLSQLSWLLTESPALLLSI